MWPRATHVQLGHFIRAFITVRALSLHQGVEPIGKIPGSGLGSVLVDQGGAHGRVAHPVHELAGRGTGLGHQVVAGVAKVVEVESFGEPRRLDGIAPANDGAPVTPTRCRAPLTDEDQRVLTHRQPAKMAAQLRHKDIGERNHSGAVVFRWRDLQPTLVLDQAAMNGGHSGVQIDIATAQGDQFTPAKTRKRSGDDECPVLRTDRLRQGEHLCDRGNRPFRCLGRVGALTRHGFRMIRPSSTAVLRMARNSR